MSEHNITVQGGSSVRLPTAGKYCDRDIVVTAEGGGGAELPALNNPASETDVVKGKEYIDASGAKKTGTVEEVDGQVIMDEFLDFTYDGEVFAAVGLFGEDKLVRAGSVGVVFVSPEWLGDAKPEDVAAGKTFTSAEGTKVPGTLEEYLGDYSWEGVCTPEGYGNNYISASVRLNTRRIYGPGINIPVSMEVSAFGDATPEDVTEGRTFTSASGLKIVGTKTDSGGSEMVFYTYVNWSNMVTIKMRVPYDGITWREYITYDEFGIQGASIEYDLMGVEQVRVGTSLYGYPVYLVVDSPDALVPIFDTTDVVEFVP